MKLDNKGFGLKELLFGSVILFLILLILSYYVYTLYKGLNSPGNYEYARSKVLLENAAKDYSKRYGYNENEILTYKLLRDYGLIEELGDNCKGYVILKNYNYEVYVKCDHITSEDYDENIA